MGWRDGRGTDTISGSHESQGLTQGWHWYQGRPGGQVLLEQSSCLTPECGQVSAQALSAGAGAEKWPVTVHM